MRHDCDTRACVAQRGVGGSSTLVDQHRSTLELVDQRATVKRGAWTDVGQHVRRWWQLGVDGPRERGAQRVSVRGDHVFLVWA